jgi:hypothetical protein
MQEISATQLISKHKNNSFWKFLIDAFVKSPRIVMPDLIRHPELIEFTGFRLSPE